MKSYHATCEIVTEENGTRTLELKITNLTEEQAAALGAALRMPVHDTVMATLASDHTRLVARHTIIGGGQMQ